MIVVKKDIIVVIINFFLSIGSFGAPGSLPKCTLSCFFIPIGSSKKRISHHKITKITTKVSNNYSCSNSIKVP